METPKLSIKAVTDLLNACLVPPEHADGIDVEGIVSTYRFDPEKIKESADEIGALLDQLPETFQFSKGGGWSFLQACVDRNGEQWGEHPHMEALVCLGIAAGKARWMLPRQMWSAMPGGMPYFVVVK